MKVTIPFQGRTFTLTDEHSQCANGIPVLVSEDGKAFGPWDNAIDDPDARMSGGERYHWQMTARAIASYARDDHPNDDRVKALLAAFNSVRNPDLMKSA